MSKKNEIYDVSAELTREFGEVGTQSRAEATAKAWEEYNAQIMHDETKEEFSKQGIPLSCFENRQYLQQ